MNLAYPIQAILMYLAIYFAPPDVNKIIVEGPGDMPRVELARNGLTWESGGNAFSVEDATLVRFGPNGKKAIKISDFIALPGDHDWSKNPKFTLGDSTILEKVETGFRIRRNSAGGEWNGDYQIRHGESDAGAGISVNVLGDVLKPGVYEIPANGSVLDALAAAGGPASGSDRKRVSTIRGQAGSVPKVTTFDLTVVKGADLRIEVGDTVYVPALSEDDSRMVGGAEIAGWAAQWLRGIDAGNYGQSWKDAAVYFQSAITEGAWVSSLEGMRKPLGSVKSRKIRDATKANSLPGAPDGEYMVIQFDTSFSAKEDAVETVTFMLEKDVTWKAAGYFVR